MVLRELADGPVDLDESVASPAAMVADDATGEPQRCVTAERHWRAVSALVLVDNRLRNSLRNSVDSNLRRLWLRKYLRNHLRLVTLHAVPPARLGSVGRRYGFQDRV